MRSLRYIMGAAARRRTGSGPSGPMVWSANTGADFSSVENEGIRSSGGSGVVGSGIWAPGTYSDTMLWRPNAGFNTTNIPDPITSATFRIYMFEQFGASVVNIHENLRPWVLVSWTQYDVGGGLNWATAGATGSGDRSASTIGSQATPGTDGVWIEIALDASVVNAWRVSGASPANGIQLRGDGQFSSYRTNQGPDGFRPELVLGFD